MLECKCRLDLELVNAWLDCYLKKLITLIIITFLSM